MMMKTSKKLLWIAPMVVLLSLADRIAAQQTDPAPPPTATKPAPPKPKPLIEQVRQFVLRAGATIDTVKSTATMIVSNLPDAKGGKTNIVMIHDRRKNFLGFYLYNFGSVKDIHNREEVYKYLLSINDSITVGSFFVDSDEDIGYKYLVNAGGSLTQPVFDSIYLTMAAVAREHRPEIRKLLGGTKEDRPPTSDK